MPTVTTDRLWGTARTRDRTDAQQDRHACASLQQQLSPRKLSTIIIIKVRDDDNNSNNNNNRLCIALFHTRREVEGFHKRPGAVGRESVGRDYPG